MKYYLVNIYTEGVVERFSLNDRDADTNEGTFLKVCCVFGFPFFNYVIEKARPNDKGNFPAIDEYLELY